MEIFESVVYIFNEYLIFGRLAKSFNHQPDKSRFEVARAKHDNESFLNEQLVQSWSHENEMYRIPTDFLRGFFVDQKVIKFPTFAFLLTVF